MEIDTIIDFSVNVFKKLFKIDLEWFFAEVNINISEYLKKSVTMAYSHADKCIVISPYILEQFFDEGITVKKMIHIIFSLIAHEFRHAWQYTKEEFKNSLKEYKIFSTHKESYVYQDTEIDAYAFQLACYWIISDNLNSYLTVPEELNKEVNQLAIKLYYQYCNDIKLILKDMITKYPDIKCL